jgi:hypothetical protein
MGEAVFLPPTTSCGGTTPVFSVIFPCVFVPSLSWQMSVFHHHQQIDGHEERGFSAPVDTRARADLRQENAVCCSQVLAPMFVLSLSWQKHRFKYKTTSRKKRCLFSYRLDNSEEGAHIELPDRAVALRRHCPVS